MGKSKRNSPKPSSNRAEKLAARAAERERLDAVLVPRPYAGLAAECDLVALREFVPSATAPLPSEGRALTLATVLPGAAAALVRNAEDGTEEALVGEQVPQHSGNVAADLAAAIVWTRGAKVDDMLVTATADDETPSIVDVIGAHTRLDITVHDSFDWWLVGSPAPGDPMRQAVEQANSVLMPSARLDGEGLEAAWWVDAGDKAHLRWVRPEDEDALMAALARLAAADALTMGEGSRFAGSFRAHGLLVPVFDLDPAREPQSWVPGTQELGKRLLEALASDAPLTAAERRSRDGIRGRQVTLR